MILLPVRSLRFLACEHRLLDLYDRRIVSYVISDRNDNAIVFDTFKAAVKANPDAHPLFHSDRGFQYTSHAFHHMLEESGMTQSMSRVAHCIDNGPMEGFWSILNARNTMAEDLLPSKSLF